MGKRFVQIITILVVLLAIGPVLAQEPKILTSKPADGSTGIPVDIGEISIYFKQPMNKGAWSLLEIQGHEFPPLMNVESPWQDDQTFVLKIKDLKPGTKYGLQLNNAKKKGFKSADGNVPLIPTPIRFETAAGSARKDPEQEKKRPDNKPLTDEERVALHLMGGVVGIFFHEFGHGLIDIYNLPVTGREEDVVDEFSTMLLLYARDEGADFIPNIIIGFADFFRRMGEHGGQTPYWDEHTDSMVRYGNIVCLLYGSSPEEFQDLANQLKMPERRQYFCRQDYSERKETWEKLLRDHIRENGAQGPGKVNVVYGETKSEFGRKMAEGFKKERVFEQLAEGITQGFALPYDIDIVPMDCGQANAYWDPENKRIVMCWELLEFYVSLLQKESGPGPKTDAQVIGQWGSRLNAQGITYTFQLVLNDKGQYYSIHEQWRGGMRYYWEEEMGAYGVQGENMIFKIEKRSDGKGSGKQYSFRYTLKGNVITFHNLPSLGGRDLVLQRMQ
jgi:hypothetical protein